MLPFYDLYPHRHRKGHSTSALKHTRPAPARRALVKPERDNHEDESKIIFFIITIGGALLFPFYGPSTS